MNEVNLQVLEDAQVVMHVAKVALGTLAVLTAMFAFTKAAALVVALGALAYMSSEIETLLRQSSSPTAAWRACFIGDNTYTPRSDTPALYAYHIIATDIQRAFQ